MVNNSIRQINPVEILSGLYNDFAEKHPDTAQLVSYALGTVLFGIMTISKYVEMKGN